MPRLLQVTTIPLTMEAFLLPYAAHFRQKGWVVHGAAANLNKSSRAASAFNRCFNLPFSRKPLQNNLRNLCRSIRALVAENEYDIVHVHTPIAAFITRFALRGARNGKGRPVVIYTAHGFHFHRLTRSPVARFYKLAERVAARWTDYLIVINRDDFTIAQTFFPQSRRVRQFPGIGIDLSAYSPSAVPESAVTQFRKDIGLNGDEVILLTVGELNPGKRHTDAILALRKLMRSDVHLVIAGEGPLRDNLLELARQIGLGDRVHLLGFRKDMPVIFKSAAALLFPSEREGLSRSIMEAMALDIPVIGSNARGVKDLVENGSGLSFEVGDVEGLARAVNTLLSDRSVAQNLVAGARASLPGYSLAHLLRLHESLYNEALSIQVVCLRSAESAKCP